MRRLLTVLEVWLIPAMLLAQNRILPNRIIENVPDGIIVTYQFPPPLIFANTLVHGTYFWQYVGFGVNDASGEPSIPFRTDMFVVPAGNTAEVNIVTSTYSDTTFILSPAVPNLPEDDTPLVIDSIAPYHGFFPTNVIGHDTLQDYRGVGLQRVTIMPIQYDYENHVVRAYSTIQYKITFVPTNEKTTEDAEFPIDADFLSNITLNYGTNKSNRINARDGIWHTSLSMRPYLIVTTNEYLDSIQGFAEWKRIKGNQVFYTTKNKGSWTNEQVTDSITYYFQQYGIQNLLIIGGVADVPAKSMSYSGYTGVTDYMYGLPSTDGSVPQIHRGRVPADTSTEAKRILDKIIHYELIPVQDSAFYRKALHCAQFQDDDRNGYEDRAFTLCSENIRNHLITNCGKTIHRVYYAGSNISPTYWNSPKYSTGQLIPDEIRPNVFSWNGKAENIREKIDEGVFYVLHRDHGSVNGWEHPCFNDTSIVNLTNGEKLPLVFSLNCKTGSYQYAGNCFTEAFLKHPNGGCVGIYGATATSFSGYNDAMALGMFDAIWPGLHPTYPLNGYNSYTPISQPRYELGSILDQGLQRMSETWGIYNNIPNKTKYTWKLFHCFGDPSMRIYTETPQNFAEPLIFSRGDSIFVFVEDGDCRITFYNKITKEVKSYEGNYASYHNPSDNLIICLDRHNYVPYIWDYSKDVYIQNENITNETRVYRGNIIYIGNHVTGTKPVGDVNIQDSQITITGNGLDLQSGTYIDKNFIFQNQ